MADRRRPRGFKIFQDKKPPYRWRCYHRKSHEAIDLDKFPLWTLEFNSECHRIHQLVSQDVQQAKPGTLGMLISKYRGSAAFQNLAPRTQKDYQQIFSNLQKIENTALTRFTSPFIVKLMDKVQERNGWRRANYTRTVLSLVFAWGKQRGFVKENPAEGLKGIRRPKSMPPANRPWEDYERMAVVEALPDHMRLPIVLMMNYGIDPSDALALPRNAISGGKLQTRRAKTLVPVSMPLTAHILAALGSAPAHDAITLCANSRGRPWTIDGFRSSWEPIRRKLEAEEKIQPGLTLKGLRHTVATILAESGVDAQTIADYLGQKTTAMARHYSKTANKDKKLAGVVADFEVEMNKRNTKVVKLDK